MCSIAAWQRRYLLLKVLPYWPSPAAAAAVAAGAAAAAGRAPVYVTMMLFRLLLLLLLLLWLSVLRVLAPGLLLGGILLGLHLHLDFVLCWKEPEHVTPLYLCRAGVVGRV